MKFQFEIPQELYMFMQNLIYDKFWEQDNKKIADKFMNVPEYCQDGVGFNFDLENITDENIKLSAIPKVQIE
jgi:hypothetical protein